MVSSSGSSWGSAQSTIISQLQTLIRPVSNLRLARLAALWDSYSRKQNPLQKQIKIWIWGVKKVWKNLSNWMFSWKSAIYWCFWKVPPLFHNENRRHLWNQEKKKKKNWLIIWKYWRILGAKLATLKKIIQITDFSSYHRENYRWSLLLNQLKLRIKLNDYTWFYVISKIGGKGNKYIVG